MTTSETSDGKLGVDSSSNSKLTIERANTIGWYFIQSYYEHYNSNIDTLYHFYTSGAFISHGDLGKDSKVLHQANGSEAIKKLFTKLKAEDIKNKIIIITAEIQITLNNAILIVVNGEWSKNSSKYYQFSQTFVLAPGIKESSYDIANDVLKFIDYEYKHDLLNQAPTPSQAEEVVAEKTPEPPVVEVVETPAVKEEVEQPVVEEQEPEKQQVEAGEPQEIEEKHSETEEKDKDLESPPPQNGSGGISWAAVATTAKDKTIVSKSPSISKPQPKKTPVTTPAVTPTPTALPNGRYKKEDWFPIYVRGCEGIAEKALKDHLTKQFGEIKFFRLSGNIALCDFFEHEGQKKALDAKKTVVDGNTILLEVREAKTDKKDSKKDKPYLAKRKTEKKPIPPTQAPQAPKKPKA